MTRFSKHERELLSWAYRGIALQLVDGDIARQDTDAVTTAAHWRLNGGSGTDGTIHALGGPSILAECRRIGGCPIGDAVVTGAGDLAARYIIHAVGPVCDVEQDRSRTEQLLASAYRATLTRAVELGVRSVSIPAISTGAFGVPLDWAVPIAVTSVLGFLERSETRLELVRHVVYTREHPTIFERYRAAIETRLAL